jgi:hypothetical protein
MPPEKPAVAGPGIPTRGRYVLIFNKEYIRNMEDVLAPYEKPSDPKNPVICVDEKPVQH